MPPVSDLCDADDITQAWGPCDDCLEWWDPAIGRRYHAGIDLGWSDGGDRHIGSPIRSTRNGVVVAIGPLDASGGQDLGPFAPVVLTDAEGAYVQYGHASAVYVAVGERVRAGQVIAAIGSRGTTAGGVSTSTAGHLHLEVRADSPIQGPPFPTLDPRPWLRYLPHEAEDLMIWTLTFGGLRHIIEVMPDRVLWQHYRAADGWQHEKVADDVVKFHVDVDPDGKHLHVAFQTGAGAVGDAYQAAGSGTWTTESVA